MPTIQEIVQSCEDRLDELEAERRRIKVVLNALRHSRGTKPLTAPQLRERRQRREEVRARERQQVDHAPYGYKANGKPRLRPDYSTPEGRAKSLATRRAKAAAREAEQRKVVRLNVQTTAPLNRDEARAVRDGKVAVAGQT